MKRINDVIKFVYFNSAFGGGIPAVGIDSAKFNRAKSENTPLYVALDLRNFGDSYNGTYLIYPSSISDDVFSKGVNRKRRVKYVRLHDLIALGERVHE